MADARTNIVLIGMPGSGKSTVGVILAKRTSRDYVDTDVLIQTTERRSLQDILDAEGHMRLRSIEERVLLGLNVANHVIATGGSAAYSAAAMEHLKEDGFVVFLDVDIRTLRERVDDFDTRGIAKSPGQTFEELFDERGRLYRQHAEAVIPCSRMTQEQVCAAIVAATAEHTSAGWRTDQSPAAQDEGNEAGAHAQEDRR
jgi:shikimate kinase